MSAFVYPLGVGLGIAFAREPGEAVENVSFVGLGYGLRTETGKKLVLGSLRLTAKGVGIILSDIASVGRATMLTRTGTLVSTTTSTAYGVGSGIIIGYGLGAAVGTGAGYLIDGSRGANAARDLYTGQVRPSQYQATLSAAIASRLK